MNPKTETGPTSTLRTVAFVWPQPQWSQPSRSRGLLLMVKCSAVGGLPFRIVNWRNSNPQRWKSMPSSRSIFQGQDIGTLAIADEIQPLVLENLPRHNIPVAELSGAQSKLQDCPHTITRPLDLHGADCKRHCCIHMPKLRERAFPGKCPNCATKD